MDYDPLSPEDYLKATGGMSEDYKQYISDLTSVSQTPQGARFICALLDKSGALSPAWTAKNAEMARNTVLKDFGQDILDDLALASEEVHDDISRMMRIRRKAFNQFLNR